MALRHLTDDEIQEFLAGNKPKKQEWLSLHLKNCDVCQRHLLRYQNLVTALEKEVEFNLPADFSISVIKKIATESVESSQNRLLNFILVAAALLIGMGTALFFTDLKPMLDTFKPLTEMQKYFNFNWLPILIKYVDGLNLNIGLLGFALLILSVVSAIDHFILQSKHKLTSFLR